MCEYCENDKKIELDNPVWNFCGININDNEMEITIGYETALVEINFCPMCSRNLKERSNEA